jgi:hypothetical protein
MAKRLITTTVTETEDLDTDDIEEILSRHFKREGWDVKYDWRVGQWVHLKVKRTKTTIVEDGQVPF